MPCCAAAPISTSSTSAGSTPARSTTARTTWPPSTGASVSLKAPRKALPIGVRATATMTASFMLGSCSEVIAADGFSHAGGLGLAFDFHGHAHHRLHAAIQGLGAHQLAHAAHACAHAHRRRKTHLVAAVIDAPLHALDGDQLGQELVDQRQRQVAVRDAGAVGALRGALRVDVQPLVVAGGMGELVDLLLGDAGPGAGAEVVADGGVDVFGAAEDCWHCCFLRFLIGASFTGESCIPLVCSPLPLAGEGSFCQRRWQAQARSDAPQAR
ncbi:exported protein of unknown function [Cupriavidus taiwanensis]|nr:exported protein of unknown function [Cupriavidus taiwanensis]